MKRIVTYLMAVLMLGGCVSSGRKAAMRAELDSINAVNRSGQPFTVADVKPYVAFFDDHGTPNDRLLAHYLLGLAYYDHGEAPMALQCYQEALDCADTTATDCDYAQLSRVYAQMADIFYDQDLFRQQLDYQMCASKSAWKGKDTLAALMSYEMEYLAYNGLGLTDSAIFVIEDAAKKYEEFVSPLDAAICLGTIIRTLIDNGDYQKAKKYMDVYESWSGLFDSQGNIESGREIYYKAKGLYYLYNNVLDSAELFFRKELQYGTDFDNQNAASKGLAELYQRLHNKDSVAKYMLYAYDMSDSIYTQKATKDIKRIQSMYDYSRHQEETKLEAEKATRRLLYILLFGIALVILLAVLAAVLLMLNDSKRKRQAVEKKYQHSLEIINQAQKDVARLQQYEEQNAELIAEKMQLIHKQEMIRKGLLQHEKATRDLAKKQFKETAIYLKVEKLSQSGKQPSESEWQELQEAIFYAYPHFSELMTKHCQQLEDKEYKTCILVRAGFTPGVIASMLGTSYSTITQIRIDLYNKLFATSGSSKEFDIQIRRIF